MYSAAQSLVLTSTREGWPNVVLESLACGTPVVAVDVGAVREMLTSQDVGRIVASRDARALASAVLAQAAAGAARERVRAHAASFDWQSVSKGQLEIFDGVIEAHRSRGAMPASGAPRARLVA